MENNTSIDPYRVLILKSITEVMELKTTLEVAGMSVDCIPAIALTIDPKIKLQIPHLVSKFDGLIITSPFAASCLLSVFPLLTQANKPVICVGKKTASILLDAGVSPQTIHIPSTYSSDAIQNEFGGILGDRKWLHLRSSASKTDWGNLKATIIEYNFYSPISIPIAIPNGVQYDYVVHFSGSIASSYFIQHANRYDSAFHIAMGKQTAESIKSDRLLIPPISSQSSIAQTIIDHTNTRQRL